MAAKGTQSKIDVGNQIIGLFGDNAFWNGEAKELRINVTENGEPIQVKIALTVAKNAVEPGDADAIPGAKVPTGIAVGGGPAFPEPKEVKIEASEEEKGAVAELMRELNL